MGSRDRKMLNEMAYSWYRCSKVVDANLTLKEKVATCLRLCKTDNVRLQQLIEPIVTDLPNDISLAPLFPHSLSLSAGIANAEWLAGMLTQPSLFIRIRKNGEKIKEILQNESIPYKMIGERCMALPNGTNIDQWLPEYMYVVQDASSQKTGDYFDVQPNEKWWDCCAGAGGKSLLLKDKQPLVDLTVSDTRKTILNNLKERFRMYSHIMPVAYEANVADRTQLQDIIRNKEFDNIICDVPCTGSGTWSRTPEQLYFFKPETADELSQRQLQIATNAAEYLRVGGKLYYITCSVFQQENEDVVTQLTKATGLTVEQMELINGTQLGADSMFIAVLKKG